MNEFLSSYTEFVFAKEQKEEKLKREKVQRRKKLYSRKPRKVNHGRCI